MATGNHRGPTGRDRSARIRRAAVTCALRYLGSTTPTSSPRFTSAAGSDPRTSARPPVLMNGAASDATIRIRLILLAPDQMLLNFSQSIARKLVDHFKTPGNFKRSEFFAATRLDLGQGTNRPVSQYDVGHRNL